MTDWQSMESFPKNGTSCDILCKSKDGIEIVATEVSWAREPIGNNYSFFGKNNRLSSYLTPISWKLSKAAVSGNVE
jgi:hypothetical protein